MIKHAPNSKQPIFRFIQWLLLLFLMISMIFSLRLLSSVCIILLVTTGIINFKRHGFSALSYNQTRVFLFGACLIFLVSLLSIFYSQDRSNAWSTLRIQSGLIAVPPCMLLVYIDRSNLLKLMQAFCLALGISCLICLGYACYQFTLNGDTDVFYYHRLASPIKQHAIYLSVLIFIAIVFLIETVIRTIILYNKLIHSILLIILIGTTLLLSSKLVIVFLIAYTIIVIIARFQHFTLKKISIAGGLITLATILILVSFRNPINKRFAELSHGKIAMITHDKFDRATYFNGLQFRLLQWRITANILNAEKAWLTGVGIGDSKTARDLEYKNLDMYLGDPSKKTEGYQIYNSHNQFLETIIQTGIIGLVALIVFCTGIMLMIRKNRQRQFFFPMILLLAWMFTESVFETQYGVLYLTFLPLLLYQLKTNHKATQSATHI